MCLESLRVRKNGTFTSGKGYWGRISKDGSVLMLSNEGQWINVFRPKMSVAYHEILHFSLIHNKIVGNKKELKELIKN